MRTCCHNTNMRRDNRRPLEYEHHADMRASSRREWSNSGCLHSRRVFAFQRHVSTPEYINKCGYVYVYIYIYIVYNTSIYISININIFIYTYLFAYVYICIYTRNADMSKECELVVTIRTCDATTADPWNTNITQICERHHDGDDRIMVVWIPQAWSHSRISK